MNLLIGNKTNNIIGENQFNLIRPLQGNTRENPLFSEITLRGSMNHANYEAMYVSVERQLARGLRFSANYAWAHSIDDIFGFSGLNEPGVSPQTSSWPQTDSLRLQRGSSAFDVRHDLKFDYCYEVPTGRVGWLPHKLAEAWVVGGITRISSGLPFTVLTGTNVGDGVHPQRPDLVCGNAWTGAAPGLFAQVLNASCFQRPAVRDPQNGFFVGNLGRNTFTAPALVNFDFSLTKNTRLGERLTHQFRAEAFNILNNTNFQAPVTQTNNPSFGKILGAAAGREIQFAMKLIF